MRLPPVLYRLEALLWERLPEVRSAQARGLALWVYGTILANSACQNAVIGALSRLGSVSRLRQYLREWLKDGCDKSRPCAQQVDVDACFASLLEWVIACSGARTLALALDATTCRDRVTALVLSVLYRGAAIPVAWRMLPANQKGSWKPEVLKLLGSFPRMLAPKVSVVVMVDRGLWSQEIYQAIKRLGWHPLMRLQGDVFFRPEGEGMTRARCLLAGAGQAWIGRGEFFRDRKRRLFGTLVAVWLDGYEEPMLCVTDMAPQAVGPLWYRLRMWIELGFRFIKSMGWQWERTRRVEGARVQRHWLVLAVATLLAAAYGTLEDLHNGNHLCCDGARTGRMRRFRSVLASGLQRLRDSLVRGWIRSEFRLVMEPLPSAPPNVEITYHGRDQPT
jgi:hypothetical protein